MPISSSPATFTVGAAPGTTSQAVAFAIPAGIYASAVWAVAGTCNSGAGPGGTITTTASGAGIGFTGPGASGLPKPLSDSEPASSGQMTDINAAAGGTLNAHYDVPTGSQNSISGLTLALVMSSPAVPQMDYVGAPPWAAPPMQARAFAGGLGFFTPGAAPAPPGIMVVFGQTAPPAPAGGQATRGYNGVVQADPPPPITNVLAFLRFSMCRDNRGAVWTQEYQVGQKADIDSCGGCWLGNGFGCLYSQGGALFWVRSDNPHDWTHSTPQPVNVTTGHVYGMAQNRFGVLCAIVGSNVILSLDRGATWSAPITVPISDPSAKPVTIATTSDEQAFVIVQPNGDGTNPTHWVSYDGGATWL